MDWGHLISSGNHFGRMQEFRHMSPCRQAWIRKKMVVKVRQAMIVPHSVQGGAIGCKIARPLRSGQDPSLQLAAMDKLTAGVENRKRGGHDTMVGWQRAASESSISLLDSLAAGRDSSSRVKFMCSFGGKIFPRPSDGKLRYVGGDTKIIAVNRDASFRELLAKMTAVYGQSLTLKYQLPDEDLDALISVSSDEDLQYMMEEYDKLERAHGSSRLRVFLFPAVDFDSVSHPKESAGDLRNSERRYMDAVNGSPEAGPRPKMETYVGSGPTFPIEILIGLDVPAPEVWNLPRNQEAVPVSMAGPPIAHNVAPRILRVSAGIPVSTISSRPSAPSAPSSAPSSPPLRPRSNIGKMPVAPDLLFQYHQDTHVQVTPQYNMLVPEGNYQDNERYGRSGTSSAASQHEPLYRSSESRTGPDSPPRKQHEVGHQDHILRAAWQQQALGRLESLRHEQVPQSAQLLYETNPDAQSYDLPCRAQIPLYKGLNPFQEKLNPYQDHQEIGDGRRHQRPQQRKGSQFLPEQQQHLHPLHQNQRLDYQDPVLQQAKQMSGNPQYQENLNPSEWDSDEARLRLRGRTRTGPFDDELHIDCGVPHQREMQQASFSDLLLPESSDDSLSGLVEDFTSLHGKNDSPDQSGSIGFQFRPGMLPPSSMGPYSNPKPRTKVPDSSGVPRYVPRSDESDYLGPPEGLRAGGNGQDLRPFIFEVNGHQHTSAGVPGLQLPSGSHRLEERPVSTAFQPIAHQLKSLRLGDNTSGVDIRWNGGLGPDDVRIEVPNQIRNRLGSFGSEGHLQGLPNLAMSRGSRISRMSSSTNIPSLIDEDRGDAAHLHADGTQGRSNILVYADIMYQNQYAGKSIPSTENVLFTPKTSRSLNPSPPVNTAPATSTGLFAFDRTPPSSTSSSTQLTVTQHLAEDMAFSVLESSPIKVESDAQLEHMYDKNVEAQGQSTWPEAAPAADPWENVLDNAVVTKHEISDGKLRVEEDFVREGGEVLETATSISKDEDSEDALADMSDTGKDDSTVKNAAADEVIAHGLQTVKNNDLEELRELGSGTFGTVYHGKWRGTDVAIKRMKASCFAGRPSEQEQLIADFWREACNLGNLRHPNVVAFYGVVSDGPDGTLATITEYMVSGSLKQVLQKKDRTIDRRKRLLIAMDSAFGMEYLHGKNIVHFDLKCENLLVNMRDPHRPICKVGDLGLSKVKHQTMVSGGARGTLSWMAPELLNGRSSLVTEKVDVFSFGIVMWELLTGEEPYANMQYGAIIGGIVNNTLRPPIPTWCDPGWRSLMERCWSWEPASRPSFSEIASELRAMSESLGPKAQPH